MVKRKFLKSQIYFIVTLIFIYVLLFGFILPPNNFLPKPAILYDALISLFVNYNFVNSFFYTAFIVYISITIAYFLIKIFAGVWLKFLSEYSGIIETIKIFKYLPVLFFVVLYLIWLPASLLTEILFGTLIGFSYLFSILAKTNSQKGNEYILSAESFGISSKKIYSEVRWKICKPGIYKALSKLQITLWGLILLIEFISESGGVGFILRSSFEYSDLSVLIVLAIIISLIILLGNWVLNYLHKKYIYWEI